LVAGRPIGAAHTLNHFQTKSNGHTLIVTREDHNIEDIHVQMVLKVQREKKILIAIEGNPQE